MTIKVTIKGQRVLIMEGEDRNGPVCSVARTDKAQLVQALQAVTQIGDNELVPGRFGRQEDYTANPVGMFQFEADADEYLRFKGSGFRKASRVTADGFDWIVETKP